MEINIPDRVRGWIYVSIAFLTPTSVYLQAKGIIGTEEAVLLGAYTTAAALLARLNVTPK